MAVEIERKTDACQTDACEKTKRAVLDKLQLSAPLLRNIQDLRNLTLVPLNCSFGVVSENEEAKVSLRQLLRKERKKTSCDVTILFAVRRPGCAGCREHALQLSEFAKTDGKVALVATVKETGRDDQDILDFYEKYFHHAIYKDPQWGIYKAMGSRKVSFLRLVKGTFTSLQRFRKKNIENTLGASDGWTQGGILIFDREGHLRFAYEENFGDELDMNLLEQAVVEARLDVSNSSSSMRDGEDSLE